MIQSHHLYRLGESSNRLPFPLAIRRAYHSLAQKLGRGARILAPTIVALSFAGVAHAQGTMDFSGAQTLMGTFNSRFAYVSVSRASSDAQIYTNDASSLAIALSHNATKTSAVDLGKLQGLSQGFGADPLSKGVESALLL